MIPSTPKMTIGKALKTNNKSSTPTYTYNINWHTGRVEGMTDKRDAMEQAIYMILMTERFEHLIYSWNYGTEWDVVIGKSYPVVESELKRIIVEALLQDDRITEITDMKIEKKDKRTVTCSFTAHTIHGSLTIEKEAIDAL